MTFEQIEQYLENAGYETAGMTVEEIEVLAGVEGFSYSEKRERYYYKG